VAADASGDKKNFEVHIMKVAIAKEGDFVSEHFGHCTEYAVFNVENKKITSQEILESPGHEPGKLPVFLAGHKVTHVLAGGMGPRAVELFCANNIEVFLGVRGEIETVVRDFMAGKIAQGESSCTHGPDHECSGH
jgi:predicted Fe-Mo cluster-binding NifX family protein